MSADHSREVSMKKERRREGAKSWVLYSLAPSANGPDQDVCPPTLVETRYLLLPYLQRTLDLSSEERED